MNGAMSLLLIGAAMIASASACSDAQSGTRESVKQPAAAATAAPVAQTRTELTPEERKFYRDVARSAWAFMDANYNPSTGLVRATADWPNTTIWDVGGQLLAFRAAKELGLLSQGEFNKRVTELVKKYPLNTNF